MNNSVYCQRVFYLVISVLPCLFTACHYADNTLTKPKSSALTDTLLQSTDSKHTLVDVNSDTAVNNIDTSTMAGKRQYIMQSYFKAGELPAADYDSLVDLNYDGYKDYLIGYYGLSGTGLKNGIYIFRYHPELHNYLEDEQLSGLTNPSFYLKQKKITEFYISYGGGSGRQLEWINNKWVESKRFRVLFSQNEKIIWKIEYPLKNKKEDLAIPFQMVPPKRVLETKYLPYKI